MQRGEGVNSLFICYFNISAISCTVHGWDVSRDHRQRLVKFMSLGMGREETWGHHRHYHQVWIISPDLNL